MVIEEKNRLFKKILYDDRLLISRLTEIKEGMEKERAVMLKAGGGHSKKVRVGASE